MSDAELASGGAGVHVRWGMKIPLRDGIHLNAILYLPEDQKRPAPAIFTLTPYIAQSYHDRGVYFAAHGYPFLAVDVRGRGDSEGVFKCYGNELEDSYDVVEWLAQQPYCNQRVAMWGGSYGGFVQWAAASGCPPHLATMVPVAAPFRGVDSPMRNNIFAPYRLQWLTMLSGRSLQDKVFADRSFWSQQFKRWFESGTSFAKIDTLLGNPSPILQDWLSHPHLDAYWDNYNPTAEQYSKISIPILTITGIYDGDQPGALMHYRQHLENNPHACHYLVIGPWDHAGTRAPKAEFRGLQVGPASLVDLPRLHVEWYAWTMQGGPKPDFLRGRVAYYVMGAEKWRYADTLEAITARSDPLYLRSTTNPSDVFKSGSLTIEPPTGESEPDHYIYDPSDVSHAELECAVEDESLVDQRMVHAAIGKHLVYHSAPFVENTEISGFFRLSAWLSIDQPDTDFQVSVYAIGVDGRAIQLTNDSMRARYRESLRKERLIRSREPQRYDFARFTFVSRLIQKGDRLRLVIGPVNSIYSEKNYNDGSVVSEASSTDARPVTVKLFHDESHPSALYVPCGQPEH